MERKHFRTCNLCEAMCGLEITLNGDSILAIKGDADDSFSRGYHCIKGETLKDLHEDPRRLRKPIRRTKSDWEEISWETALDEVASRLASVQGAHGRDAVATYIGNPNAHNYGSFLYLPRIYRALKTNNRFSATSVDQLPHHVVAFLMFGHQLLLPIPDIDRTSFMLILGGNPAVSRGSMMTAPDVSARLSAIRSRGGSVVLIDPRRTETAPLADEHYFIRPGTDAALLLAMLSVIFEENLAKPARLEGFTDGIRLVRELALPFAPSRATHVTGIDADAIFSLARRFAAAPSAVCYGRVGVSTQEFGTITQWLLTVLNIVTGNFDRAGGAMFTTPAVDPLPYLSRGHFGRYRSRVRGLPEFAGELPVSTLTEEIMTPGPGQVRALLTVAGNPVLTTPSGGKLGEALAGLDFMASVDIYLNETTKFANIILPPTFGLEHDNYDGVFHLLAVRNTAKFTTPCVSPTPGSRHDWQILGDLARRLTPLRASPKAMLRQLTDRLLTPERIVDMGLRFGPYGSRANVFGRGLSVKALKRQPHGIDLGPLQPQLPTRLFTKSKRIDLAPPELVEDLKRLERTLFAPTEVSSRLNGEFDMLLIGRRQVRTNNSWMGHIERLTRGRSTCTMLINERDATRLGIVTGDSAVVTSRAGSITLPAVVISGIMPGVVSVPHGYGHHRHGTRLEVREGAEGVSANDVTDATFVDALTGNAALNGVPVRVAKAAAPI